MVFNVTYNNITVISWQVDICGGEVMVFNVTYNNITVISWQVDICMYY